MKKVLEFFKKPLSQQAQQDSSDYRLVSNNSDDSFRSVSSVPQQQQLSQEEVRQQRLARLDKQQQNVPQRGPSKDITNHPLTIEYGQNAYLVHMFLEDLYLNTYHSSSLQRNPQLKLFQPSNPIDIIKLYTQENMGQDIMKILQSETYYPTDLDKLTYLHDIYGRVGSKTQENLISEEKIQALQKTVLKCLMDYLSISISTTQEDPRVITDFKNPLYDSLYTKLSAIASNGFFHQFIRNLPEEKYDVILTPIFKRMIRDTAENSVSKREKVLNSITVFQELMNSNPKIVDFLFQHELHIPKDPTGQDYQRNTVFGVLLSFTIMNNTGTALMTHIDLAIAQQEKAKQVYNTYRKKTHASIDAFQKLLESLIKLNPKYKRNILDWFHGVIKANESMQTTISNPEDRLSSRGWFCNFFVLLLKLCENMLKDPQRWISKIDLNYIHYNPIFENRLLLDGTKLPPCPTEKYQELQKSKFSFGTELIFAATYSWFLLRDSVNAFSQIDQSFKMLNKVKESDEALYQSGILESGRFTTTALIQLFDPYLLEQLHRLLNFQTLLMLHAHGQTLSSPQDISNSSLLFEQLQAPSQFPILKFWPINVINYLDHFTNVADEFLSKSVADWDLLMNFVLSLAANKFNTSHHDLKALSLRMILKISEEVKQGVIDQQIGFILKTSPFYQKNLSLILIGTFLEAKEIYQMPNPSIISEPTRLGVLQIFNSLLESVFANDSSYLMQHMKDLFNDNKEKYLQFMNIFMDDMVSLLDDISAKLASKKEPEASLLQLEVAIRLYHLFAFYLSFHCPELVLDEIVRDQFAVCLNYSIKVLNAEGFLDLVHKSETSVEFAAQGVFIANFVGIYLNLAHNDDFMQSVVNDKENCGLGYFYQTQYFLEGIQTLSDGDKEKFSQLIGTLELLGQSNS